MESNPDASIFQSYDWHAAWWQCFGRHAELFLLAAESGGELVAVLPLMKVERRVNGRVEEVLEFIGAGNRASDYCDAIAGRGARDALLALLRWLREASGWTTLDLINIREDSPLCALIPEAFPDVGHLMSLMYEAPTCVLGDAEGDRRLLGKKSLKRHVHYFQRSGLLTFRSCSSCEEALRDLDLFFEQHIARREMLADRSLFHDQEQRRFYRELVRTLLPLGVLKFSSVRFNEEPLAFHFGFEYQRRFVWYKPTFAVSWAKKSPGEVLLWFLLREAVEKRLEEFDFTVGEEDYKYRFSNKVRNIYRAIVFRRPSSYYLMNARRLFSKIKGRLISHNGHLSPVSPMAPCPGHPK